ncbi:MAG: hypothetical protein XD41_0590 [Desulfonauticus sp. 38_4375]|nr:MAG: hypothetical protein XD41_0590 [Desulfonauticus sp. 38_4375]
MLRTRADDYAEFGRIVTNRILFNRALNNLEKQYLALKAEYEELGELLDSVIKQRNFLFREAFLFRSFYLQFQDKEIVTKIFGGNEKKAEAFINFFKEAKDFYTRTVVTELFPKVKWAKEGYDLSNHDPKVKERYLKYFGKLK